MEIFKIVFVSDWYYLKFGGVVVYMYDFVLYLWERGYEVDIIMNNRKIGKEDELREFGIGFVKVLGKIFLSVSLNVFVFVKGYGLFELLVRGYEVVYGYYVFIFFFLKVVMVVRKFGKGSVVMIYSINYENFFIICIMLWVSYFYYCYYLIYFYRIIVVSKVFREFIKRFIRVLVRIVFNGINIERFDIFVSKEEVKEFLNFDGKVVFYVGCFEFRKGVGIFILVMKDVDGIFLVVGLGSMLFVFCNKVKFFGIFNRVKFFGMVSYLIFFLYYCVSDVFVFLSLSEVFGIVFFEVMVSGMFVVGIKVGGIFEIVDGCGMLVFFGNVWVFSSVINEILNN